MFDPTQIQIEDSDVVTTPKPIIEKKDSVEKETKKPEPKEEPKESKEPPVKVKKEEEVEKNQTKDIKDSAKALVKYWIGQGYIDPEFDLEGDLSRETLLNAAYDYTLKKSVEAGKYKAEQEIAQYKAKLGIDDKTLKVAAIFGQGGDPRFLDQIYTYNQYLALKIEDNDDEDIDEKNQEEIIRFGLGLENTPKEEIDDKIDYYFERGKALEYAKKYKKKIEDLRDGLIEAENNKRLSEIDSNKEQAKKSEGIMKKVITKNKEMWKVEPDEFIKDVFELTEFVQVKDKEGNLINAKATKLQKKLYDNGSRITTIFPADENSEGFLRYVKTLHDFLYNTVKRKAEKDDISDFLNNPIQQTDKPNQSSPNLTVEREFIEEIVIE